VKILHGWVLIRVEDLAKLASSDTPEAPAARHDREPADWRALASAVALITDRVHRGGTPAASILGDTPRGPVISALAMLGALTLTTFLPAENVTSLLATLGLDAADGITNDPDGSR
jgi:hypothetical protein